MFTFCTLFYIIIIITFNFKSYFVLQVDPGPYVDTCLYVYCSLGANEREAAVCDTLASYVRECAQQHVILSWRGPGLCGRLLLAVQ